MSWPEVTTLLKKIILTNMAHGSLRPSCFVLDEGHNIIKEDYMAHGSLRPSCFVMAGDHNIIKEDYTN